MGALKSITHSYSYGEYLLWYIERNDLPNIEKVFEKRPDLINSNSFTANFKTTPLHRAAVNGNLELAKLLVEKYHAEVDARTTNGETPLIGAVKKGKFEIVRYLLAVNASADEVSGSGLKPVDYAILHGFYDIALALYEHMQENGLKDKLDYEMLGTQYNYRYVNYAIFL
jgi:ankyrin repeat protein